MKRGQVESQFNWIFVLIAGAVILMVAFTFIMKQQSAKKLENADKMLKILDEITTGAGIAEGTAEIMDLPRLEVRLECTDECTCTVNAPPAPSQEFASKIIFGPQVIERRIMLWAQSWSMPFRVTNFIFVASPTVKYYIVREPGNVVGQYIEQRMPEFAEEFEVEYKDSAQQMAEERHPGTEHVRIVYVGIDEDCQNTDSSFIREDYSCVVIEDDYLKFYENKASRSKSFDLVMDIPVFEDTALFGAIFAGDAQQFACNMHKAFGRLEKVAKVYKARTSRLEALDNPNVCEGFSYEGSEGGNQALVALDLLIENSGNLAYEMQKNHLDRVKGAALMIKGANRMADNEGCPTIY